MEIKKEKDENFDVRDLRKKEQYIIDDKFLNGYAKYVSIYGVGVYCSLCRHADKKQKCYPSIQKMAEELNISKPMVIYGLWTLEFFNIIKRKRLGKQCNNRYFLIDKRCWKLSEIAKQELQKLQKTKSEVNKVEFSEVNKVEFNSQQRLLHELTTLTSNSKDAHSKDAHSKDSVSKADSPHHRLFAYFDEEVKKRFGVSPEFNGARDGKLISNRLKKYGEEKVKKIIDYYLDSEKCKKFGFNLSVALSADTINHYLQENEAYV